MKCNNKKGYTLVELMIYMFSATIVVFFTFSLMRTTSITYTKERKKSSMQTDGKNAISIMGREIMNTGFKSYFVKSDSGLTYKKMPMITLGENGGKGADRDASLSYLNGNPYDLLMFYKGEVSLSGEFSAITRVTYSVSDSTLNRSLSTLDTASLSWGTEQTYAIASNIEALQFEFSTDHINWSNSIDHKAHEVKAIKIHLLIRTNQKVDIKTDKTYTLGSLEITRSDNYLRRVYTKTVEVVNNGI